MPRKRKPSKNEQDAWEEVLAEAGLSMEAGRTARISYVGTSAVLERIEGEIIAGTHKTAKDLDRRRRV
jgi:hypothetical protein